MSIATPFEDLRKGDLVYFKEVYDGGPEMTSEVLVISSINHAYKDERFRGHVIFEDSKGGVYNDPQSTKFFVVKPSLPTTIGMYILVQSARRTNYGGGTRSFEFKDGAVARFDGRRWSLTSYSGDTHSFLPNEITNWSPVTLTKGK